MIRERLFSLVQRTKACFMSFRVSLTPATMLRRAIGKCECVLNSCSWVETQDLQMVVLYHNENRWLGRSRKEFKIVLSIRRKIEMSVMQVFYC
jgi:hypothetical protein